jgi:hypothetical protein
MMLTLPSFENLTPDALRAATDEVVDALEEKIMESGGVLNCEQFPVVHRFTDGMYVREIHMPAGAVLTSKIHKTEHPFVILKGSVSVWSANEGSILYKAPYLGITKPGTRRILFVHSDTVWATFHSTGETEVEAIEAGIIENRENPRLKQLERKNYVCLGEQ